MKVFLKRHLNIFPKLRHRLLSIKWILLVAATTVFFISAAAPPTCVISFGGTTVTGPTPTSSPPPGSTGSAVVSPSSSAVVGMGGSPPSTSSVVVATQPPSKAVVTQPPTGGAVHTISIILGNPTSTDASGFLFKDSTSGNSTTTITKGTTVEWINPSAKQDKNAEPHTITADDNSFGTPMLKPGATYSHTFAIAGTFMYSCEIHPGQMGMIIVKA